MVTRIVEGWMVEFLLKWRLPGSKLLARFPICLQLVAIVGSGDWIPCGIEVLLLPVHGVWLISVWNLSPRLLLLAVRILLALLNWQLLGTLAWRCLMMFLIIYLWDILHGGCLVEARGIHRVLRVCRVYRGTERVFASHVTLECTVWIGVLRGKLPSSTCGTVDLCQLAVVHFVSLLDDIHDVVASISVDALPILALRLTLRG